MSLLIVMVHHIVYRHYNTYAYRCTSEPKGTSSHQTDSNKL